MGWGAAIGGALSAVGSIVGGSKAAKAQTQAANTASDTQLQMFDKMQNNLAPYMQAGTDVLPQLENMATTGFTFNPTQADIEATPGYKFNLTQGLKAVQNGAAARGLGVSGASYKGAADFATGLADSTYQNQFNNKLQQYMTNFANLENVTGVGENAAAGVGQAAIQTGSNIGQNIVGAGNARAAADMNTGNAIGNGVNSYLNYNMMNQLIKGMYGQQ